MSARGWPQTGLEQSVPTSLERVLLGSEGNLPSSTTPPSIFSVLGFRFHDHFSSFQRHSLADSSAVIFQGLFSCTGV